MRKLYEEYEKGSPQFRLGLWRQTFDTPSYKKFFAPAEETELTYFLPGNREIVVDRVCTKSYIAVLPDDKKNAVRSQVTDIVDQGDGKIWIDESTGVFQYPYKTYIEVLKRK